MEKLSYIVLSTLHHIGEAFFIPVKNAAFVVKLGKIRKRSDKARKSLSILLPHGKIACRVQNLYLLNLTKPFINGNIDIDNFTELPLDKVEAPAEWEAED